MAHTLTTVVGFTLGSITSDKRPVQFATGQLCIRCRKTRLSRYNNTKVCAGCTDIANKEATRANVDAKKASQSYGFKAPSRRPILIRE